MPLWGLSTPNCPCALGAQLEPGTTLGPCSAAGRMDWLGLPSGRGCLVLLWRLHGERSDIHFPE